MVWSAEKFENNMRIAETQWKTQIIKHSNKKKKKRLPRVLKLKNLKQNITFVPAITSEALDRLLNPTT